MAFVSRYAGALLGDGGLLGGIFQYDIAVLVQNLCIKHWFDIRAPICESSIG